MSTYWICDSQNRVLGPIGLEVVSELLVAGRIDSTTRISRDGQAWWPLTSVPELARMYEQRNPEVRLARERAEAQKLRAQLEGLRVRPAHEIFKVAHDAPVEVWREAFFKLSKRFHPDSIPADTAAELKEACATAFRFLSTLMTRVENGAHRVATAESTARLPTPPPSPTYDASAFVGIKPLSNGEVEATIRVTAQNLGMFTDHPMMNLPMNGFFLADTRVLKLGTTVRLTFNFGDGAKSLSCRGRVAWEDAGRSKSPRGFGISFLDLRPAEKEFLKAYVERHKPKRAANE